MGIKKKETGLSISLLIVTLSPRCDFSLFGHSAGMAKPPESQHLYYTTMTYACKKEILNFFS